MRIVVNSYQVFLASSINEFKKESNDIGDFIRTINDVLIDYDIRIKLFECEFSDNSIVLGRMQEIYNREIPKSEAFIMLIGKRLGEYTLEEYNVATKCKVPRIYILFNNVEQEKSVIDFQELLNNNEKSIHFNNEKEIHFYISKVVEDILKEQIDIKAQEDKLYINGEYVKY